ncbi:MAG: WD40 repeat domain-containing protein, partial [Pseudomonadota bacterium]|nr:WD40 repeat domain-containing protein [Pseudomonadota bacterium]
VLLCQPGSEDALFAKPGGGGGVTALVWSPSGRRLALGTSDGEAAILLLPPGLLRARNAAPRRPQHEP